MKIRPLLLSVVVAFALLHPLLASPDAKPNSAERCAISKLHATASLLAARLRCAARATREGVDDVPTCDAKADDRLRDAFARIQARGGCESTDDAEGLLALSSQVVFDLELALRPVLDTNSCAVGKLRAVAKRSFAEVGCIVRSLLGKENQDECLARVSRAFGRAFRLAERRVPCLTTGDAETIESSLVPFSLSLQTIFGPTPKPDDLAATIDGGDIDLTWTAPNPLSGNTHVKILRRLSTPPTFADDPDATEVFFGTATSTTDDLSALLPDTPSVPRTYHYAAFGCTSAGACGIGASRTSLTPTVTQALVAGGYVIHFRHGLANICSDRTDLGTATTTMTPDWWKSCDANCPVDGPVTATARQIAPAGAADAVTIGNAFRSRGIPVGRVLSSEFCRTVTTAQLMNFGPTIEQKTQITFFVYDEAQRCANTQLLLAEAPAAGTNTTIIGHAGFTCPVLGLLNMGEGAIFKPDGAGDSTFIATVLPNDWATLP